MEDVTFPQPPKSLGNTHSTLSLCGARGLFWWKPAFCLGSHQVTQRASWTRAKTWKHWGSQETTGCTAPARELGCLSQRFPKSPRSRKASADLCGLPRACAIWPGATPPRILVVRLKYNYFQLKTGRCENYLSIWGIPRGPFRELKWQEPDWRRIRLRDSDLY